MSSQTIEHGVSEKRLWFSLVAGPSAWALHGLISVILSSHACRAGTEATAGPIRILLGLVTLAALALATAGALSAYRNWRRPDAPSRPEYMALIGFFSSCVFVLGLLWAGIPPLLLDLCDQRR